MFNLKSSFILTPVPKWSFLVSTEQLEVFLIFQHLYSKSETYVHALFPKVSWARMYNFSLSPSIAFVRNSTYKGLIEVTNKVNAEKIIL